MHDDAALTEVIASHDFDHSIVREFERVLDKIDDDLLKSNLITFQIG